MNDRENIKSITFTSGNLTDIWIEEASEVDKEDNDTVCLYRNETYTICTEQDYVECGELYERFSTYCKNNGFKALNNVNFFKRFYKFYPNSIKKRARVDGKLVYVVDNIQHI